jgi:hypothetical protein
MPLAAAYIAYLRAAKRRTALALLSGVGTAVFLAVVLAPDEEPKWAENWEETAGTILIRTLLICLSCALSLAVLGQLHKLIECETRDVRSLTAAGLSIIFLTMVIGSYAKGVYQLLPREWGGGKKPIVDIVFKNAVSDVIPGGKCFGPDSKSLDRVELVAQTEERYYINLFFTASCTIRRTCPDYRPYSSIGIGRDQIVSVAYSPTPPNKTRVLTNVRLCGDPRPAG